MIAYMSEYTIYGLCCTESDKTGPNEITGEGGVCEGVGW